MLLCSQKKAWSLGVCRKQHWPEERVFFSQRWLVLEIVLLHRKVDMMGKLPSSFVRDCRRAGITSWTLRYLFSFVLRTLFKCTSVCHSDSSCEVNLWYVYTCCWSCTRHQLITRVPINLKYNNASKVSPNTLSCFFKHNSFHYFIVTILYLRCRLYNIFKKYAGAKLKEICHCS